MLSPSPVRSVLKLEELRLAQSAAESVVVDGILALRHLKSCDLSGSRLTKADQDRLRKGLPDCEFLFGMPMQPLLATPDMLGKDR